ncbi:hypothetical protein [Moheibacter sediminis]|uniref:PQQ-like domain-containing protein n=1 Tax=Moheibacter sediminis TaxID=1434700 RepID=A0A1W2CG39_9FLAO|nr:hypothetical protein [Moheibacter sediminis]SMC84139.1 hypothetical protein SAMN06296427_11041 [Moheibacter sediminis]
MKELIIISICVLLLYSCKTKENKGTEIKLPISEKALTYPVSTKSKKEYQVEEDTLYATLNNYEFIVYPTGEIDQKEKSKLIAKYKLQSELTIEKAYLQFYKDNLIVYYTENAAGDAASFVESINRKTQINNWKLYAYAFNLGQPVIENNAVYISTLGFVGKVDLDNGKYLWKNEELYSDEIKFNQCDSIIFNDNDVIFIADNTIYGNHNEFVDSIIVNDKTGKIKRIAK